MTTEPFAGLPYANQPFAGEPSIKPCDCNCHKNADKHPRLNWDQFTGTASSTTPEWLKDCIVIY